MDWETYAWLKRGIRRMDVLNKINSSKNPLTIKDIKIKSKVALPQISATIKELYEKKLIDCLNPADKIGKLYQSNTKGKALLGAVQND